MKQKYILSFLRAVVVISLLLSLVACLPTATIKLPANYSKAAVDCIANNDPDTSGTCHFGQAKSSVRNWSQIANTANKILKYHMEKSSSDTLKYNKLAMINNVLTDETHSTIMNTLMYSPAISDKLSKPGANQQAEISSELSFKQLSAYYTKIWMATQVDAWEEFYDIEPVKTYQAIRGKDLKAQDTTTTLEEQTDAYHLANFGSFLKAYMKAYFRGGHFAKVELDRTEAQKRLKDQLKEAIPDIKDSDIDNIFKNLDQLIKQDNGKYALYSRVSDDAFRSRSGADYGFPVITMTITPFGTKPVDLTKIDFLSIGTDVLRVFIEASGDALFRLPGDPSSTACKEKLLKPFAATDDAKSINPSDPAKSIMLSDFAKVNALANSADAATGIATAQVIRGLAWYSLNNEALAKLVETTIAASSRKFTEKAAWCAFSCYRAGEGAKTLNLSEKNIFDNIVNTNITIK